MDKQKENNRFDLKFLYTVEVVEIVESAWFHWVVEERCITVFS
jgi:hypothetical protein